MIAQRVCCMAAVLLLSGHAIARDESKQPRSASFEGATGLFRVWDAETLRKLEANASLGWNMFHRDPGQLRIDSMPLSFSFGLHDRLEVFGSLEAVKRIEAGNIRTYRVLPGRLPVPAWTPQGAAAFTNDAPFIDVPLATGLGDIRLGAKLNLFSEWRKDPLAVSVVGFVTLPTASSRTRLNRGFGSGEVEAGWGALMSKSAGRVARVHLNTMVNWVSDPEMDGIRLAELQNEFWWRGGGAVPNFGRFRAIVELEGRTYFGARTLGLNPRSPLDLILGFRVYPRRWISLGAGYRASLNHIREDRTAGHLAASTSGFVVQVAIGKRTNDPPTVTCVVSKPTIKQGESTTVRANAVDPDGDALAYAWSATGGKIDGSGETVTFDATGLAPGKYTVTATVRDKKHQASCTAEITVLKKNLPPIARCSPAAAGITQGESIAVSVAASDPNNDPLTYSWTINAQAVAADGPQLIFGSEGRLPGVYSIMATVSDGEFAASCSSTISIRPKPNRPPNIECLTTRVDVAANAAVELRVRASDPDGDPTTVTWLTTGGSVKGSGEVATFDAAGLRAGTFTVTATADDGREGRASCSMTVSVTERLTLPGSFKPGSAYVDNVNKAALDELAVRMKNDTRLNANIIGYTDGSKQETSIKDLGRKRAQAVADYLKNKGVDPSRLTISDGGSKSPVGDDSTPEGRKKNRRVEIVLTAR